MKSSPRGTTMDITRHALRMPPGKRSRHFVFSRVYPVCPQHFALCAFIVSSSLLHELSFSQTGLWLSYLIIFVCCFWSLYRCGCRALYALDHLWCLWALSFHTSCLFSNFLLVCLFQCSTDIFYTVRMSFRIGVKTVAKIYLMLICANLLNTSQAALNFHTRLGN